MEIRQLKDEIKTVRALHIERSITEQSLHPVWRAFIRCCAELQHGEIELLKIQDGLPVLAEVTRKKIKFVS